MLMAEKFLEKRKITRKFYSPGFGVANWWVWLVVRPRVGDPLGAQGVSEPETGASSQSRSPIPHSPFPTSGTPVPRSPYIFRDDVFSILRECHRMWMCMKLSRGAYFFR